MADVRDFDVVIEVQRPLGTRSVPVAPVVSTTKRNSITLAPAS